MIDNFFKICVLFTALCSQHAVFSAVPFDLQHVRKADFKHIGRANFERGNSSLKEALNKANPFPH
jgi:hypothetical protein